MSKREKLDEKIWETKMRVFERDGWQCVYVDANGDRCPRQATELAHILPKDVLHLARYGPAVIHHDDNMRGTCSDKRHNASVQINYRARPVEADRHAATIRAKLEEEV